MRALHIFDFDDTLVRSTSRVIVNKEDGSQVFLTSVQYKKYKPEPGDEFDYSEFDKYPMEAEIIDRVFAELKAAAALDGTGSVVVLTARQNPQPVRQFLADLDLSAVHVVATGSDSPSAKSDYILSRLESGEFDEVVVFEDSTENIRAIKKAVEEAGYNLEINRVTHKGIFTKS